MILDYSWAFRMYSLADATEAFAKSLNKIDTKLKYSIIVNATLFVILGVVVFLTAR